METVSTTTSLLRSGKREECDYKKDFLEMDADGQAYAIYEDLYSENLDEFVDFCVNVYM